MLGHIGIDVPDLATAQRYYDQLMPLLDYEPFVAGHDQFAYRPTGRKPGTYVFFYPAPTEGPAHGGSRLQHLAFMVPTRTAVDRVAGLVDRIGSAVLDPPRHFAQYPQPYYACFWRDPFGLKLEAVCHHDRA